MKRISTRYIFALLVMIFTVSIRTSYAQPQQRFFAEHEGCEKSLSIIQDIAYFKVLNNFKFCGKNGIPKPLGKWNCVSPRNSLNICTKKHYNCRRNYICERGSRKSRIEKVKQLKKEIQLARKGPIRSRGKKASSSKSGGLGKVKNSLSKVSKAIKSKFKNFKFKLNPMSLLFYAIILLIVLIASRKILERISMFRHSLRLGFAKRFKSKIKKGKLVAETDEAENTKSKKKSGKVDASNLKIWGDKDQDLKMEKKKRKK